MAGRFFDFDAARAERLAEPPPTMRAFGETVDLPRSVPAAIHLTVARRGDTPINLELVTELLGYLVGAERVERWLAEHPSLEADDIAQLYYGAMRVIQLAEEPDPEEGPPATGAPKGSDGSTSPSTGAPSKPTSPASTASTSPPPSGTT